jgi:two-component system LytT family response regulator
MTIRAVIVEDEPLARQRLRQCLDDEPDVEVLRECSDGRAAARAIRELAPDLVFLDVQIPEMNGFAVLEEAVSRGNPPLVVFVTAYDEYALRGFEVNALDYLLKPFTSERLADAIAHARVRLGRGETTVLDPLLTALARDRPYLEQVSVRRGDQVLFVRLSDVLRIDAADNYVTLRTDGAEYLWRETMNRIAARLDPGEFIRVQRSAIVRIRWIATLDARGRGDYDVVMRDGGRVGLGRTYRAAVMRTLVTSASSRIAQRVK